MVSKHPRDEKVISRFLDTDTITYALTEKLEIFSKKYHNILSFHIAAAVAQSQSLREFASHTEDWKFESRPRQT